MTQRALGFKPPEEDPTSFLGDLVLDFLTEFFPVRYAESTAKTTEPGSASSQPEGWYSKFSGLGPPPPLTLFVEDNPFSEATA